MLEDSYNLINQADEYIDEIGYRLAEEFDSSDPNSIGQRIRVEVMESPEILTQAIELIARDQLWDNMINRDGDPMPLYKKDTLRKKRARARKMGYEYPMDKIRYTYFETGAFYNEGIYIYVDASQDIFLFRKTNNRKYFKYLMDEAVGLTEENMSYFEYICEEAINNKMLDYYEKMIDNY